MPLSGRKVYHRAPAVLHVSVAEITKSLICWHPVSKPEHEAEELEMIVTVIEQVGPTMALASTLPGAEADVSQRLGQCRSHQVTHLATRECKAHLSFRCELLHDEECYIQR